MKKKVFYTEIAYFVALIMVSFGNAFMEKANLGINMVVAPVYLTHFKLVKTLPFFTFGFAEYTFQGILILITMLVVRRAKIAYLFSFCTALIYGTLLDLVMGFIAPIDASGMAMRILLFSAGVVLCAIGVSLMFHTYISPEAYELFVKETSKRYHLDINKFKLAYDCVSLVLGVILSFIFFGFGRFEGVKVGTVICAFVTGPLIGVFSRVFDSIWDFRDALKYRSFFEASAR